MKFSPSQRNGIVLILSLMFGQGCVYAEAPKADSGAQQALRKAQGMLRQMSQDKAALETEKAALAEQVKKLETQVKQLEPLQGEVVRQKAAAESMRSANVHLESQISSGRDREEQLHAKLRDIVAQAKQIQGDNQLLVAAVKEREQWIGQCSEKNQGLLKANQELLGRYKEKGFWDQVAELEPLTGIGKVQAETAAQDYRFKLEDLKVTAFKSSQENQPTPAPAAESRDSENHDADEGDE